MIPRLQHLPLCALFSDVADLRGGAAAVAGRESDGVVSGDLQIFVLIELCQVHYWRHRVREEALLRESSVEGVQENGVREDS